MPRRTRDKRQRSGQRPGRAFDESEHPRGGSGKWVAKRASDPDTAAAMPALPPRPAVPSPAQPAAVSAIMLVARTASRDRLLAMTDAQIRAELANPDWMHECVGSTDSEELLDRLVRNQRLPLAAVASCCDNEHATTGTLHAAAGRAQQYLRDNPVALRPRMQDRDVEAVCGAVIDHAATSDATRRMVADIDAEIERREGRRGRLVQQRFEFAQADAVAEEIAFIATAQRRSPTAQEVKDVQLRLYGRLVRNLESQLGHAATGQQRQEQTHVAARVVRHAQEMTGHPGSGSATAASDVFEMHEADLLAMSDADFAANARAVALFDIAKTTRSHHLLGRLSTSSDVPAAVLAEACGNERNERGALHVAAREILSRIEADPVDHRVMGQDDNLNRALRNIVSHRATGPEAAHFLKRSIEVLEDRARQRRQRQLDEIAANRT